MARRRKREVFQALTVRVTLVEGHREAYYAVQLGSVAGVDGTPYVPRTLVSGLAGVEDGWPMTKDKAGQIAIDALREAFPDAD